MYEQRFKPRDRSFFGLGHNSEGITDLKEFLAAREMDYAVEKQQVSIPTFEGEGFSLVQNQYVIRRKSDGEVVSPMTVSKQYGEISPMDMVSDLEPFVLEGFATPDSAFKIRQGCVENVEAIALRLDLKNNPFDENFRAYLVARNYHGRGSASANLFLEREISNSLLTAVARVSGFTIVHRGDVRDKYKLAMKRWADLQKLMQSMATRLSSMASVPMSFSEAESFVWNLLDIKVGKKISSQKKNLCAAYLDAFNMPRYGTYGKTSADMYYGVTWVGSHYTAASSKLNADDIMIGLLEGTRGARERKALGLLDAFVAKKLAKK